MSTHPDPTNFFKDFLEDYFAECEDHLTVVRRELLAIEPDVGKQPIERTTLNQLFRSFHSLKGLSGMVGVKNAEELAHEMESYLRVLRDQAIILSPPGFDALLAATKGLEQTITAHRHQTPSPDIQPTIAALKAVIPQPQPPAVTPAAAPQLQLKPEDLTHLHRALIAPGAQPWHFIFTPTPELSTNGINVNKIRDRLQSLGELVHAAPRMTPESKIAFDFLIVSSINANTFREWENDFGLTYSPYLPPDPSPQPPLPQTPEAASPDPSPPNPQPLDPNPLPSTPETDPGETSPPSPPPPSAPLISQSSNIVRVDLPKLDELMRIIGNLVITRARLQDHLTRIKDHNPTHELRPLIEINQILERQLRDLRESVMRVRLVPIGEIFARMQFVVRDLIRETSKQIRVELSGQETEIDKLVVERMMDPLLHLVRNAVSHGLETTQDRSKNGKPPEGKIALRAKTCGEIVIIEIEDDGRGINPPQIIEKAIARGLLPHRNPDQFKHQTPDPTTLLEILCTPGFSTREIADLASGRGVGMAIVKNTIQELGGTLTLDSTLGQSTKFTIELPLTLAIADAFLIRVSTETYAIPQTSVREAIALNPRAVTVFEQTQMIPYRGKVIPLLHLQSLFNLHPPSPPSPPSSLRIIIVGSGPNTVGLAVDRIIGQREIVVRPLNDPLVQVLGISGATEIGDGRVILILDIPTLVRSSHSQSPKNAL